MHYTSIYKWARRACGARVKIMLNTHTQAHWIFILLFFFHFDLVFLLLLESLFIYKMHFSLLFRPVPSSVIHLCMVPWSEIICIIWCEMQHAPNAEWALMNNDNDDDIDNDDGEYPPFTHINLRPNQTHSCSIRIDYGSKKKRRDFLFFGKKTIYWYTNF